MPYTGRGAVQGLVGPCTKEEGMNGLQKHTKVQLGRANGESRSAAYQLLISPLVFITSRGPFSDRERSGARLNQAAGSKGFSLETEKTGAEPNVLEHVGREAYNIDVHVDNLEQDSVRSLSETRYHLEMAHLLQQEARSSYLIFVYYVAVQVVRPHQFHLFALHKEFQSDFPFFRNGYLCLSGAGNILCFHFCGLP